MEQTAHFQASHDSAPGLMATEFKNWSEESRLRQHLQILLPILAVYLVLAFYGIGRQGLWEDEYNSVWRVTASQNAIWKDGHGFLYFALLSLWIQLGTSELVLRSLSVLLGAVAVCLMYALGSTLLNRRAAVFGTALFATSPFLIWYSQEARYITLMLVSTLLAMYAFERAISQQRLHWWLASGAATLLAVFSFLSTLLLPVVQGLYLLGSPSRRPLLRKWIFCQAVVFTLFAWWFVNGTHFLHALMKAREQGQQIVSNAEVFPFTGDFNKVRPEVIPYTFFAFSVGFSLGPSPRELYADRSVAPLVAYAPVLVLLIVVYGSVLFSGWLAMRRWRNSGMLLLLWITVPVLGVFGIAKVLNIFYDVRYVAMVLPAYVLFLAAGIVRFRKVGIQLLLLGAILAVHGVALANYYFNPRYAREDTRAAGQLLESAVRPGDVLLVVGSSSSLPHYYKGNVPLVDFGSLDRAGQPLPELLRQVSAKRDRIWLVQIRPWQVDRAGEVKAALDDAHNLFEQQHFSGVDIYLYRISK
jgi:mannosyltransferase